MNNATRNGYRYAPEDGALIFVNGGTGKPVVLEILDAIEDPTPIRHDMRAWQEAQAKGKP